MLYVGPLAQESGYRVAGLGYLRGLRVHGVRGFRLHQSGIDYRRLTQVDVPEHPEFFEAELETQPDWTLVHERPHRVPQIVDELDQPAVGLTVFETASLPQRHVDAFMACENLRGLVVPSWDQAEILRAQGWTRALAVIPHTWETALPEAPREWPLVDDVMRFYYIGGGGRRKNPAGVVEAYYRAFPEPDLGRELVLKVSDGIADPFECRADVQLHTGMWSRASISALHRRGACFVSAHRGEGFGLGLFEAMLSGRRVIAPRTGAPSRFLHPPHDILVASTPRPMSKYDLLGVNFQSHFRGDADEVISWWEPDVDGLAEAMLRVAAEGPRTRPVSAGLVSLYSAATVGQAFFDFLAGCS